MTCAQAHELIPAVAAGELARERAEAVRSHARECARCADVLGELEATLTLCRKAGSAPLPDGFALALHRKLVAAGPPPRSLFARLRERLELRPLSAALGAAALSALVAVGGTTWLVRPPQIAAFLVPESKVALVKIDFQAERAVDEVDFEIMLPDGLRFFTDGHALAERTFRWQGKLGAGSNPMPIAVKGTRPGRYRVVAHAVGVGFDVTHEVWLEVTT